VSTYAEHLRAAAGFAALALTMPAPTDPRSYARSGSCRATLPGSSPR